MPQVIQKIFNGKLNLDTHPYRMPPGDYIDSLNITRDGEGGSKENLISNLKGNTLIPYTLPAGINKPNGKFEDVVRNRIYDFIWNSTGRHQARYYDKATNTINLLIEDLTDTNNVAVLDFNPSKRINHVDIIYRSEDEGDLVFFTDGNTTPKKFNEKRIRENTYSVIKSAFIEVAKKAPLSPALSVYGSDTTRNANALRRKLFKTTYRWTYDDFEKSTFASHGKVPLPIGYYGSDNDFDNTFNNYITIAVQTGDENVTEIEIAVQNNIANIWGDFVLVASLNKAQLGIPDNSTYDFLFYNDNIYPPIEVLESTQLFDWVPLLADTQVMANGDTPVYGAITENYPNYPADELDVEITAANQTNIPPDTDPPSITYEISFSTITYTVNGNVPVGTFYKITARETNPSNVITLAQYTSILGDSTADVAVALFNYINTNHSSHALAQGSNMFQTSAGPEGLIILQVQVTAGSSAGSISTQKTWLWDANHIFGIVYVDEQNRDMPGVTTFSNPNNSDNDFLVTTPPFSLVGADVQTPVISAEINHLPPIGAVKYYWVRRRLTYGSFMMYETCDFQSDSDFLYFCLSNIEKYKEDNSQFIYGTAPITSESRIKVIAGITANAYNGDIWNQDYQILGTVSKTLTGGIPSTDDYLFIKVKKPAAAISPVYTPNMLVMVYTPALNPTSLADSVFWEWGEAYDIYEGAGGIMYHRGMDQDQTAIQPATFTWPEGDVYFHQRTMYREIIGVTPFGADTVSIMDANYSDFFNSAVNDNGRAQVIEVNARRQYNPVLVRFGGAYQAGTNINQTNRFYYDNFDEYDRGNGDIRKLFINKRYMYVFQRFDIGVVPIFTQIIKDTSGNPLEANSDILLNKINYPYQGRVGIGDVPESFAFGNGAKYGIDSNKGIVWRLSQDGITFLSILYETDDFFKGNMAAFGKELDNGIVPAGQVFTGNPTVHGIFDAHNKKYIVALEEINRYSNPSTLTFHQDSYTMSFNETRDSTEGFESPYSFKPELMACLNNLLFSYKNGAMYRHDSNTYCYFYGVQYEAFIKAVFNDNILEKKTFTALAEIANQRWDCPEIETDLMSFGSTPQQSSLMNGEFEKLEGQYHASFRRDVNSMGSKINGNTLKGKYIIIKFKSADPTIFSLLNVASVKYISSPLSI